MRRNPFAPVVPCHRVVASDLDLGGFSGSWVSTARCLVQVAAAWQQRVRPVMLIVSGFMCSWMSSEHSAEGWQYQQQQYDMVTASSSKFRSCVVRQLWRGQLWRGSCGAAAVARRQRNQQA
jgi:hypothetical protein